MKEVLIVVGVIVAYIIIIFIGIIILEFISKLIVERQLCIVLASRDSFWKIVNDNNTFAIIGYIYTILISEISFGKIYTVRDGLYKVKTIAEQESYVRKLINKSGKYRKRKDGFMKKLINFLNEDNQPSFGRCGELLPLWKSVIYDFVYLFTLGLFRILRQDKQMKKFIHISMWIFMCLSGSQIGFSIIIALSVPKDSLLIWIPPILIIIFFGSLIGLIHSSRENIHW